MIVHENMLQVWFIPIKIIIVTSKYSPIQRDQYLIQVSSFNIIQHSEGLKALFLILQRKYILSEDFIKNHNAA